METSCTDALDPNLARERLVERDIPHLEDFTFAIENFNDVDILVRFYSWQQYFWWQKSLAISCLTNYLPQVVRRLRI